MINLWPRSSLLSLLIVPGDAFIEQTHMFQLRIRVLSHVWGINLLLAVLNLGSQTILHQPLVLTMQINIPIYLLLFFLLWRGQYRAAITSFYYLSLPLCMLNYALGIPESLISIPNLLAAIGLFASRPQMMAQILVYALCLLFISVSGLSLITTFATHRLILLIGINMLTLAMVNKVMTGDARQSTRSAQYLSSILNHLPIYVATMRRDFRLGTVYPPTTIKTPDLELAHIGASLENLTHPDDYKEVKQKIEVGSSRVDLQACKLEYSIVSPK